MTFPFSVLLTRAGFPEKRSSAQGENDDVGILSAAGDLQLSSE